MLLVTGITGHTGNYLLRELIEKKHSGKIRCIVRKTSDISQLTETGLELELMIGDLSDQEFMNKSMEGIEMVVHLGTIFHSVSVMKAAVTQKVKKVILVHTTGIYSKYKSASEEYKNIEVEIDRIISENNSPIDLIITRPTMIYGDLCDLNMSKFIKMIDTFRVFPVINNGDGLIQPVNAKDLAKALYKIIISKKINNGDYILSGEKPMTMLQVLKLISENLGKKTTFINVPLKYGVIMAKVLKYSTFKKIDYVEKVQRMGENRSFPHDDALNDFGYSPSAFDLGIKIEVQQYLDKLKVKKL